MERGGISAVEENKLVKEANGLDPSIFIPG